MLDVPDGVRATLAASQVGEVWATVTYQGQSVRVPLLGGNITWDAAGEVETAASWEAGGSSGSLVPRLPTDFLAANGQEIAFFRDVILRDGSSYTLPLGIFRIIGNDGGWERWSDGDHRRLLEWRVRGDAAGRMRMIQKAKRLDWLSPLTGNSMWDEIRRLALFPVAESVGDRSVPPSLSYKDRMQAVTELAKLVDCVPSVNRYGALFFRQQDRWLTETVPDFDISGTITWSAPQTDEWFNEVVASSQDGEIVQVARITDDADFRSVNRAGPRTFAHSSPLYETNAAARVGAATTLRRVMNLDRTVTVKCLPEALLLDLGDFGWFRDPVQGRAALGEVVGISTNFDPSSLVEVTVRVAEVTG